MPQGVLALREIRSGEGPQEGPRAVTRSFWKVGLEEGIRWPAWVAEETPRSPLLVAAWAEEAGPRTRKIPSVAVWPEVGPCRPQAAAWAEEAGPRTRKIPSVAVWPEVGPCRPQAAAWVEARQAIRLEGWPAACQSAVEQKVADLSEAATTAEGRSVAASKAAGRSAAA
jgi:hypothetical protein